jgi:hypothetical protein
MDVYNSKDRLEGFCAALRNLDRLEHEEFREIIKAQLRPTSSERYLTVGESGGNRNEYGWMRSGQRKIIYRRRNWHRISGARWRSASFNRSLGDQENLARHE